jgi:hypothetical protein
LLSLVIGFAEPFLVSAARRQEGYLGILPHDGLSLEKLIALAVIILATLIPFIALGGLLLSLPSSMERWRIPWIAMCGLIGILVLLIPTHWEAMSPKPGGAVGKAFAPILGPVFALFPMLVGVALGWLATGLLKTKQSSESRAAPDAVADRPRE